MFQTQKLSVSSEHYYPLQDNQESCNIRDRPWRKFLSLWKRPVLAKASIGKSRKYSESFLQLILGIKQGELGEFWKKQLQS